MTNGEGNENSMPTREENAERLRRERKEMQEVLEAMVDKTTLAEVVNSLADVCREKAAHLEENWQDRKAADLWDKAAGDLENLAVRHYKL